MPAQCESGDDAAGGLEWPWSGQCPGGTERGYPQPRRILNSNDSGLGSESSMLPVETSH
jgi:hypothetical protein